MMIKLKKISQTATVLITDRAGRKSGKTFKTKDLVNMTFIDKSVTGMYERRYKINGMENSCSK